MFVLLGWIGTFIYLLNHGYISFKTNWKSSIYYGGNLVAALSLVVSSYVASSYQAVFINSFWAVVSVAILLNWPLKKVPANVRVFYSGLSLLVVLFAFNLIVNGTFDAMILGWSSAYVFTFGYLLFCTKKIGLMPYLLLNAYAAIVLLPQLWLDNNWPVFALEIAWAGISLVGAYKHINEPHLMD